MNIIVIISLSRVGRLFLPRAAHIGMKQVTNQLAMTRVLRSM